MLNMLQNITNHVKNEITDFTNMIIHSGSDTKVDTDVEADGYDFIGNTSNTSKTNKNITLKIQKNNSRIIFRALDTLTKTEPKVDNGDHVDICLFKIVKNTSIPYLMYCFYKEKDNTLRLPYFIYTGGLVSHFALNEINTFIKKMYHNKSFQLMYKGFCRNKNRVKIWIECDDSLSELETGNLRTKLWWGAVSEIINQRKILNFIIRPEVIHFLLEKPEYLFLYDHSENTIETPVIGYVGNYYDKIISTVVIGREQEEALSDTGPCYKFTTYMDAIRNAVWTETFTHKKINDKNITVGNMGRYTRGGVGRFILFLGKHTMYEGIPIKNWRNKYDSISDGIDTYVSTDKQYKALSFYEIGTDQNITPTTIHNATITP